MTIPTKNLSPSKVVLAALQLPQESDFEHKSSLAELERLAKTLGLKTIAKVTQKRRYPSSGAVFGSGKLKELAAWTGGTGIVQGFKQTNATEDESEEFYSNQNFSPSEVDDQASIVIVNSELTPTQLSNLEQATGVEVLDRTGVILEIFSRHAKSREARLQVEIAKLAYLAPRLRLSHMGSDRQGGGIGSKGAGETAHELDKRRIRDRIAELRREIDSIQVDQSNRRANRKEVPLVALIGYTNAGKSSLMRQLTQTDIKGEDKLFATLDTTIRTMQPETRPKILISDTVGFIDKLPHDLVASFKSTLDEALCASLLIYVLDGSDANYQAQYQVTRRVLEDIGASGNSSMLVVNKADLLSEFEIARLKKTYPEALLLTATSKNDIRRLYEVILNHFETDMTDADILIRYTKGYLIGKIRQKARVLKEQHDEFGTTLTIRASERTHNWILNLLR